MTPAGLGLRLGMSERAILSLLSTLAGQGQIRIRLVELVPNASSSLTPEPPAVGTPKNARICALAQNNRGVKRRASTLRTTGNIVARFLTGRPGIDFCDSCLTDVLRLARADVEEVVRRLATRSGFLRDLWDCRRCGGRVVVTRAVFRYALLGRRVRRGAA